MKINKRAITKETKEIGKKLDRVFKNKTQKHKNTTVSKKDYKHNNNNNKHRNTNTQEHKTNGTTKRKLQNKRPCIDITEVIKKVETGREKTMNIVYISSRN